MKIILTITHRLFVPFFMAYLVYQREIMPLFWLGLVAMTVGTLYTSLTFLEDDLEKRKEINERENNTNS